MTLSSPQQKGKQLTPAPRPLNLLRMTEYSPPPGYTRLKMQVQYLGTHFQGWQVQGKGERTVQGVLHGAISRFAEAQVPVACGRTDTGVHAENMPVHVDLRNLKVPLERLARALNACLPEDVSVLWQNRLQQGFMPGSAASGGHTGINWCWDPSGCPCMKGVHCGCLMT